MSPIDFELLVKDYLEKIGKDLEQFKIAHNKRVVGNDGTYQVDILASFKALDGDIKVLVECKQYTQPISREKVQILYDKVRSLGAQKGMLFTTSTFQAGAINYADKHGISLVRVIKQESERASTYGLALGLYQFISVYPPVAFIINSGLGGAITPDPNSQYGFILHKSNNEIFNQTDTYLEIIKFLVS